MHEIDISHEIYGFTCLHCGHTWEHTYEVDRSVWNGNETLFFRLNGAPCEAPWRSIEVCPNCHDQRVRLNPQVDVGHHEVASGS